MEVKRLYDTKAIHSLVISRSAYTRPLDKLKEQCIAQKRTNLEFVIWFDYTLMEVAKLDNSVFNCILELIQSKHIINNHYMKDFRLACIIMQKFIDSDHAGNLIKLEEFANDYPQFKRYANIEPTPHLDFDSILTYDRVLANKRMFPYFHSNGVSKELVAELISRNLLAFDTRLHNLIYICQSNGKFLGIEKHGIGTKHYQQLIYKDKPISFIYHVERLGFLDFKRDIKKAVFFDNTLNMLKFLSENYIDSQTAYCSLHTPNCAKETFSNTLKLFNDNADIEFRFLNSDKTQRFENPYAPPKSEIEEIIDEDNPPFEFGEINNFDEDDLPF